jgi:tetratricopeptide (TPR) repeat protein
MSKKQQKDSRTRAAAWETASLESRSSACAQGIPDGLLAGEVGIRELIAEQHSKAAVEAAKQLHKRWATPASESVLMEAYQARARDLLHKGMAAEARSLLDFVIQRFPSARLRFEEVLLELRLREGNLDKLVAPLNDPSLPAATREKLETIIRQRVCDLSPLSSTSSLAPGHSLRAAAAALNSALKAVTSGPVAESDVLLPQVSRRNPLASWKALINAIAGFYRQDDVTCRRWLQAIAPDSPPARLVPAIEVMLGSGMAPGLNPAARKLIAASGAGGEALRPLLVSLESALAGKKAQAIIENGRAALSACELFRPDLGEKLRQSIAVRCIELGPLSNCVRDAVGGSTRRDANWYHLMARAAEGADNFDSMGDALVAWAAFRELALDEKRFAANSLEDGVLWLHMAELAAEIPPDVAFHIAQLVNPPNFPGKRTLATWQLFSPDVLYERACAADPHPEAFQSWLAWAKKQRDWRVAERVAERWHGSRNEDVAPLLWLMESSERRGAYQKSLRFLVKAELLNRLDPDVRKAKLRLLLAGVLRHFRQRKPRLASQEIERIAALSEPGRSLPPLVSALRRLGAALDKDPEAVARYHADLETRLGSAVAAYILEQGVADASVLAPAENMLQPFPVNSYDDLSLLKGLTKACVVGESVGIPLAIPEKWEERLIAALLRPELVLNPLEVLIVGEAAIRRQQSKLAFAVSVAGLARGGNDARFLFLRARALPLWTPERRYDCLSAALELARRERNTELVGKLLDQLRHHPRRMFARDGFALRPGREDSSITPGFLNEVLESERKAKQFPVPPRNLPTRNTFTQEKELPADEFEDVPDFLPEMPPEVLRELTKAIAQGRSLEEILGEIVLGRLCDALPAEFSQAIKQAMASGVTAGELLTEIENVVSHAEADEDELLPDRSRKRKRKVGRPQQGNLF